MSTEAWEQAFATRLSPLLGTAPCEAAYGSTLLGTNPTVASAIDDYARADGPGDDLLELLAPAAKGDLIVVITLAGRLPSPPSKDAGAGARPSSSMPSMGGGRRGGGRGGRGGSRMAGPTSIPEQSTLEMSASFYSVHQHRPVGFIAMQYDGASVDDALDLFARKLTMTMPATTCAGWNWEAPIDLQRLREP